MSFTANQFQQPRQNFYQSLFGRPERNYQQSTLGAEQQPLYGQLQQAGQSGTFGPAADYYRNNLSDNPSDFQAFAAPEMRQFREQIVPDLAEQYSGYGGIGSSGFRNAAINAGTDLSERVGRIRAQIRQQSAQGVTSIGQMGLQQFNENIHRPETYGLLGEFASGVGQGLGRAGGSYLTGKIGG